MSAAALKRITVVLAAAMVALLAACASSSGASSSAKKAKRAYQLPPVKHVFVIVLENESYSATFGDPSAFPYLAGTLAKRGVLLRNYYATGHDSNDNYIALVSGQPPNVQNQADCQTFTTFTENKLLPNGVQSGTGCLYPADVQNIGTQLSAAGLRWKAYMEDMGNDPKREAAACGHPAINQPDPTQVAESGDGYATRHDPFVYFESIINRASYCDSHVVALGSPSGTMPASALPGETGLPTDLKKASTTPAFSFITPNLCDDGHDFPCINRQSGASPGADIDRFLQTWVPKITGSAAFKQGGLLEITFDEAADSDTSSCCGEAPGPGAAQPGGTGPGGGRIGALLISPYIKPGSVSNRPYNHYSSLASWEQLFHLKKLADARTVKSTFGADVFTRYRGGSH
jgi:phosphatidylinositol-3-phosphatase